jgi:3-hydroxybutyryl-CoA dehydratase
MLLFMKTLRQQAANGLKKGDRFELKRRFTKNDTHLFGDLTKDYNPVHYDMTWATEKGFNGLICHGLLVGAMICEFGGQVGWLATGMDFKFIKPVYFEDEITCCITLTQIQPDGRAKASAIFTNQNGVKVALVELSGRLPIRRERELLTQMIQAKDPFNPLSEKE